MGNYCRDNLSTANTEETMIQEACRKDMERAFGILRARFAIVKGLAQMWYAKDLADMKICIILHKVMIEDE